jgi:hypothetical protein
LNLLIGKAEGGFSDSWASMYNVSEVKGLTFATLPGLGLKHRADRIFFKSISNIAIKVIDAQLYGGVAVDGIYPSDHYGLFAAFNVTYCK